jgi:hypothetical protein
MRRALFAYEFATDQVVEVDPVTLEPLSAAIARLRLRAIIRADREAVQAGRWVRRCTMWGDRVWGTSKLSRDVKPVYWWRARQ